jgi:hypothetical protein
MTSAVPIERFVSEVWRACQREDERIPSLLESNLLFECYRVVRRSTESHDAFREVSRLIAGSGESSIVSELARRAVVTAFSAPVPEVAWRIGLFAEVSNYLVSRDLPGFVGSRFRNRSVEEAIHFKDAAIERSRARASVVIDVPASRDEWRRYVRRVLRSLVGGR